MLDNDQEHLDADDTTMIRGRSTFAMQALKVYRREIEKRRQRVAREARARFSQVCKQTTATHRAN